MNIKRIHKIFLGLLIALSYAAPVRADDDISDDDIQYALDNEDTLKKSPMSVPQCVVNKLVIAGLPALLQTNLYTRSNPVYTRSIHDLPLFARTYAGSGACLNVRSDVFYNQTGKMYFAEKKPHVIAFDGDRSGDPVSIASYIDMGPGGFLYEAVNTAKKLGVEALQKTDPQEVLNLFTPTRLQERRVGLYLGLGAERGNWTAQWAVPFYYLERNFFLTQEEQNIIDQAPAIKNLASGTDRGGLEKMLTKHMASDALGLGDMRFHLLYNPYCSDDTRATIGAMVTLPTAVAFARGIICGSFCKKTEVAPFSVENLPAAYLCDGSAGPSDQIAARKQAATFALSVLDRLTANLADASLGNSGHVALGPIVECTHRFGECKDWEFFAQGSFQYLFEGKEMRDFLLKNKNPSVFSKFVNDYEPATDEIARADIALFNQALNDIILPDVLSVDVRPGMIAHLLGSFAHTYCDWLKTEVGYDFYWRGNEQVTMPAACKPLFKFCPGLTSAATQHKLFVDVTGELQHCLGILKLGAGIDATVAGNGIGKDFTIVLHVRFDF